MCDKPVPFPYKHLLESMVSAVVPDMCIINSSAPSLNKIEEVDIDEILVQLCRCIIMIIQGCRHVL